ncbi:DUF5304 family protein, partial [Streptomyces sp. NPDC000851]
MSEERPPSDAAQEQAADEVPSVTDDDAWATACAEDLAAEKARIRAQYGPPAGSAAEELRRLVDTVADKLSGLQSPLLGAVAGPAAQQMLQQVVQQAKAAVEPVKRSRRSRGTRTSTRSRESSGGAAEKPCRF